MRNYKFTKDYVQFLVNGADNLINNLIITGVLSLTGLLLISLILLLALKKLTAIFLLLILLFLIMVIAGAFFSLFTGFFARFAVKIELKKITCKDRKTKSVVFNDKLDRNNFFISPAEYYLLFYKIKCHALTYGKPGSEPVKESAPDSGVILLFYDDEEKLKKIKDKINLLINLLIQRAE